MSEYIEREMAKLRIFEYGVKHRDNVNIASACKNLERQINSIPAADVRPVVRGKWMRELADNRWANHICSVCGYMKNTDIHVRMDYNFCPNCGADMRPEPPKEEEG